MFVATKKGEKHEKSWNEPKIVVPLHRRKSKTTDDTTKK